MDRDVVTARCAVRRLACVDLPAFPLQLLAQQNPAWLEKPMAVVAEEKPQAFLLWVNEKARALGIRPGHRYAAALALSPELRAGAMSEAEVRERRREDSPRSSAASLPTSSPPGFPASSG